MNAKSKGAGFTLIELIIVIIIIGILATFAMPAFMVTKEKTLTKEAIVNLKLIAAAEKVWRIESVDNTYTLCNCTTPANCNAAPPPAPGGCNYLLKLNLNTQNWTYSVANVTLGPPPTFTATAVRTAGPYAGCTFTITETTPGDPPQTGGTCP